MDEIEVEMIVGSTGDIVGGGENSSVVGSFDCNLTIGPAIGGATIRGDGCVVLLISVSDDANGTDTVATVDRKYGVGVYRVEVGVGLVAPFVEAARCYIANLGVRVIIDGVDYKDKAVDGDALTNGVTVNIGARGGKTLSVESVWTAVGYVVFVENTEREVDLHGIYTITFAYFGFKFELSGGCIGDIVAVPTVIAAVIIVFLISRERVAYFDV